MAHKDNIQDIWQKATEAIDYRRQRKDSLWKELDSFDRGEEWSIKGAMPSWIPKPQSNYINKVKKFKTGNLMLDDYLGELIPLAPENEPQIWMLQRFYEQLFDKLNMKKHIAKVIRTSRLLGTGILYVGWDENYIGGTRGHLYQGEILVQEIEPSTFFVDPKAFSLEEALYCGTFVRTTKDHIMMDPSIDKEKKKEFEERRSFAGNSLMGQEDRGEIYNNRDYSSYQDDVVDLVTYYEKMPNEDNNGFTICVKYIADGVLIKEIEEIQPNVFPFIMLRQYEQRQDFWGISDAQLILPNVKMLNKIQSIIGTLATLYQNPQKIVYEGSGIDPRIISKYGNAFGLVFLSKYPDLANVIRNVDVADIPMTLMNYMEYLKKEIDDFTGMTDFNTGASSGSIQTSGGVNSMIQRSLVVFQDEMVLFEHFLEKVSYALLQNAIQYYTDDRLMRMRDPNPNNDFEYEYVPFRAEEFVDLAWDFNIDVQAKIQNNEETKRETMRMLSEWQLQYAPGIEIVRPEDIVKAFNPDNRDVILARIEKDRQDKSIEKASEITQQVMQAMQAGYDPQMIAEMVFKALNPELAEGEQDGLGDVQKRQEGIPQ
jgi:hypothetical protein